MKNSVCCALVLAISLPGFSEDRFALLVGVNEYSHDKLLPLKYAVRDATEMATVLRSADYQVTELVGPQATKAAIEATLRKLADGCKKGDTFIVGLAGHGVQFSRDGDAYFCPVDARPTADRLDTLVSVTKIYRDMENSFAGVKILLIDACRNDPDPGRGRGIAAGEAPSPPSGVAALFSCGAGQRAFEHDGLQHGVFFHRVIQGLKGQAVDTRGRVTFQSLSAYVSEEVPLELPKLFPNSSSNQSPEMVAKLSGTPPVILDRSFQGNKPKDEKTLGGITFLWCPAGSFVRGDENGNPDEQPARHITLTRGFWLGKTEITQRQWQQVMGTMPWSGQEYSKDGSNYPATYVSWDDATAFCEKLTLQSHRDGSLPPAWRFSLPTEAQWEYACRAGTQTKYSFGTSDSYLGRYAWFDRNAWNVDEKYAHEAGKMEPNPWGFYDMHGNVWEWCLDAYDPNFYASPSGQLNNAKNVDYGLSVRVRRGGSWAGTAEWCRSGFRAYNPSTFQGSFFGFRVAVTPTTN